MRVFNVTLPPYESKGTGTPVRGMRANIPPKLTIKCNKIVTKVPYAMSDPVKSRAPLAIFKHLNNMNAYSKIMPAPATLPNSSTIIGNIKSVCASGKYKYFCVLLPSPTPNKPPLLIAIIPLQT